MKKAVFFIWVICLTLVFSVNFAVAAEKLKIVGEKQPPFYADDLPNNGYAAETIKQAFKLSGYDVEFEFMPFKRALGDVESGAADGAVPIWKRADRQAWAHYCDPLPAKEQIVFIKLKSKKISFNSLAELKPFKIGAIRGYSYPDEFKNAGLNLDEAVDNESNLSKLFAERVDLVVVDNATGRFLLNTKFAAKAKNVDTVGKPLQDEFNYLIISKKAKDADKKVKAFNEGLAKLKKSGKLNAIIKKHGLN